MNAEKRRAAALCAAAFLGACAFGGPPSERKRPAQISEADRLIGESEALSNLAVLQGAVNGYIKEKGSAPAQLDDLVPDFLEQIPVLDLGLAEHPLTNKTQTYSPRALAGGAPDPAALKDSGRWAYVPGERPLVFIDCVHTDSRGKPWYQERGSL